MSLPCREARFLLSCCPRWWACVCMLAALFAGGCAGERGSVDAGSARVSVSAAPAAVRAAPAVMAGRSLDAGGAAGPPARAAAHATRVLRVAADPNNLPFSNQEHAGFDNKIAEIIAADLGAELRWVWRAQRRGFFRETLKDGRADLVVGVTTGSERATTTRPLYRSTYVFVSRRDRRLEIESFDDPRLRTLRVGVQLIGDDQTNTPPAHAFAARGIVDNLVGFSVYGDYREANPPARIVDAVRDGSVDVAVVWGPLAAYFAGEGGELVLTPVKPGLDEKSGLPLVFDVSVGVAKGNTALRDELDAVIVRRRKEIDAVLAEYRVPQGDPNVVLPRMGDDD